MITREGRGEGRAWREGGKVGGWAGGRVRRMGGQEVGVRREGRKVDRREREARSGGGRGGKKSEGEGKRKREN